MRTEPQAELFRIVDDPEAVCGQVALQPRRAWPRPKRMDPTGYRGDEDVNVEGYRLGRGVSHRPGSRALKWWDSPARALPARGCPQEIGPPRPTAPRHPGRAH